MNSVELGITSLRRIAAKPAVSSLAQYLNLWSFCDGYLIGVNFDFSTVWELEPQSVSLMDSETAEHFMEQVRALLNGLPSGVTLQFVVQGRRGTRESIEAFRKEVEPTEEDTLARLIVDKKCAALRDKFTQRRRVFLYLTTHPAEGKAPSAPMLPRFDKPWQAATREFHLHRGREHHFLEETVIERLRGMGLAPRRLAGQEVLALVFAQLNPKLDYVPQLGSLSTGRTLREQLLRHPLREEFDHMQINDTYFRGISLLRLPEASHPGFTQELLAKLWPDFDFCLTIESLDTEKAVSRLKLSNTIVQALSSVTFSKNYEAEQKQLEIDSILTEIRGSAQRLFKFSLSVLIRADGLEELRARTTPVVNAFHDFCSAEGACDDMSHFKTFLGTIPGHGRFAGRGFFIPTNALAGLLPLMGSWRGSGSKRMLVETPLGEVVGLDPFDPRLPAHHGLVLGTTGSGKSFTTNYILTNFHIQAASNHIVVIDVGGSYRKFAHMFDGAYLEVSLSEQFGFNPFPLRDEILLDGELDGDTLAYLTLLISRMCLPAGEALLIEEKGFLEKAIKAAYAKKPLVILSDVRQTLRDMVGEFPKAKRYVDALAIWTDGMYGKLFNRPGRLDVSKRIVVFDLQNLDNHADLQSVYFFVIRSIIWGKLVDRSLKKYIVIDEGWKFFNDEVGSELIQNLYRTARKFNGAVLSISQSPKDFLETAAANAIITNSYVKYILKLTKGHDLLEQFDLNQNEAQAVKQLAAEPGKFSDIFIKYGERSLVARIEPCPLDYWICTTSAQDFVKEEQLRKAHPGISESDLLVKLAEGPQ